MRLLPRVRLFPRLRAAEAAADEWMAKALRATADQVLAADVLERQRQRMKDQAAEHRRLYETIAELRAEMAGAERALDALLGVAVDVPRVDVDTRDGAGDDTVVMRAVPSDAAEPRR